MMLIAVPTFKITIQGRVYCQMKKIVVFICANNLIADIFYFIDFILNDASRFDGIFIKFRINSVGTDNVMAVNDNFAA